jgi:hypothetical protein
MNWLRLPHSRSIPLSLLVGLLFTVLASAVTAQILPVGPAAAVFLPPQNVSNDPGTLVVRAYSH